MEVGELSPEAAEAVHKAKNAQQAIEIAREAQTTELAKQTKDAVIEALQNIFGGPDVDDPEHMTIIYQKIPILCIRVDAIDKNILDIKSDMQWFTRVALSAVITGVIGLVILAASKFIYG